MLGLKAAKTEAANKFRYAIDKFESTVAKADDCVTRVQMKSGEAVTEPRIHPLRRASDAQRR